MDGDVSLMVKAGPHVCGQRNTLNIFKSFGYPDFFLSMYISMAEKYCGLLIGHDSLAHTHSSAVKNQFRKLTGTRTGIEPLGWQWQLPSLQSTASCAAKCSFLCLSKLWFHWFISFSWTSCFSLSLPLRSVNGAHMVNRVSHINILDALEGSYKLSEAPFLKHCLTNNASLFS